MENQIKTNGSLNGAKIEELGLKYGFSKRFVRQCVDGQRDSATARTIKEEYDQLTQKVNKVFPLTSNNSQK